MCTSPHTHTHTEYIMKNSYSTLITATSHDVGLTLTKASLLVTAIRPTLVTRAFCIDKTSFKVKDMLHTGKNFRQSQHKLINNSLCRDGHRSKVHDNFFIY